MTSDFKWPPVIGIFGGQETSYRQQMNIAAFKRLRAAGYRPVPTHRLTTPDATGSSVVGYMGFVDTGRLEEFRRRHIPVVNVSQAHGELAIPSVFPDNRTAGRLAAEHLLERDFRTIAYVTHGNLTYSILRGEGVARAVQKAGARYVEFASEDWAANTKLWWEALRRLPLPAGLIGADDTVAVTMMDVALVHGLRVPEQLAVVGITNEETICGSAAIPLSSVDLNPSAIGEQAAGLLLRLIAGRRAPRRPILVPPRGVVLRPSSDAFATSDPWVASVVRYAHEQCANGVGVEGLARHFRTSRRHLARLFRQRTGFTPVAMLQRVAVARAKHLLQEGSMSIPQIASACGYNSFKHFTALFEEQTGVTPAVYRDRNRVQQD